MNGNADAQLLNFIYQNSQMGVNSLKEILPMVKEGTFKDGLNAQLKEYQQIHQEAGKRLNSAGYDEKGINAMEKIMTYLSLLLLCRSLWILGKQQDLRNTMERRMNLYRLSDVLPTQSRYANPKSLRMLLKSLLFI